MALLRKICEPQDHFVLEFGFLERMCDWTVQALPTKDPGNLIANLCLQTEFSMSEGCRAKWKLKSYEALIENDHSSFRQALTVAMSSSKGTLTAFPFGSRL
jgi:hypothetical protein